jgi:pimeloyl-ACP methyl ester carboxylesterase
LTPGQAAGISFERLGTGPPLALLHPLGSERGFWASVAPRLAECRDLLIPDLPGFGSSPMLTPGEAPSPRRIALALASWLDELGLARVHAAGTSLGAWVALELAALDRALSVTAMCPSGVGPTRPIPPAPPRAVVPLMPLLLRSQRFRRRVLRDVVAHPERASVDALVRFSRAIATAPAFEATRRAMGAERFEGWERLRVPVTLAWGQLDSQVTPIEPPRPGVRSETMTGCGHAPVFDAPDEVVRVVLLTTREAERGSGRRAGCPASRLAGTDRS